MEMRHLTTDDREQAIFLWDVCFRDGEGYIEWALNHYFAPEDALGIFEQGRLLSAAYTRRCTIVFQNREYFVPMIAGVATLPEARARGYSFQILKTLLEERGRAGDAFAILNTYIPDFYKRLGFYNIAPMACYRVKPGGDTGTAQEREQADLSFLERCYKEFCTGFDGFLARSEKDFDLRMQDALGFGGRLIVSENGYLVLDLKTGIAIETICTKEEELRALAHKAAQVAGKDVIIKAPPSLNWDRFFGVREKLETGAMIFCFQEDEKNFFEIGTNPINNKTWCILEEY